MNSEKKPVRLQFSNMRQLWQFAQQLTCKSIEINTRNYILICDSSEEEINVAITMYSAQILEGSLSKAVR